jgi:hypothetical protein
MKKTTSEKLSKRLLKYGAFSAAILGTANANGQIIYTDIADETVDATNARVAIDIDNDATGDYLFGVSTTGQFAFVFPASSSMAAYNSNLFVGFTSGPYAYPSNLTAGTVIDGSSPTFNGQRGDFNYNSCAYPGSQFCNGADGYMGVHFDVGGNVHYGWVRIQVSADATSIVIKDFAYNSTPGDPIEAGQQSLSIDDFDLNDTRIVALNKSIGLYNLSGNSTNYNLYDITGKVVLNGTTSDDTHVIEAASLSSGIYIVELRDSNSSSVLRKKVVL